ncbi:MAG: phosphatase PAP2 family protein [Elusimicrobiaceae bacterium]|nr:phosphatase PAP2 family protein [Elusimicrobiaceae bacterium]
MDISYLLFLQAFRNSIHDAWTPFMEAMSLFSITYLMFIPVFIYWCVSKRKGLYTLASFFLCVAVNAVLKLTMCVYRPWIRDPRIIPAGDAIATAGGYSFPSGHTTSATPLYGGLAVGFWDQKATKWLSILCIIALLITGFSRNYLGVHTPQDVGVGLCLGVLTLWVMAKAFKYLAAHPEKENRFLLIGFIVGIVALLYINFKPYPLDYVDGKLLVDPLRMTRDAYQDIGVWLAFCAARYVEKRWIRFTETGFNFKGIVWALIGMVPAYLLMNYLRHPLIHQLGPHWGRMAFAVILVFYVIALYPWFIKLIYKPRKY